MLDLYLLRHADAAWVHDAGNDFTRRLSELGHEQAERRAEWLALQSVKPDAVLCSSAIRTRETLQLLSPKVALQTDKISYCDEIYDATVDDLLSLIQAVPAATRRLLLVGHNPSISELISKLTGKPAIALATAGFAHLQTAEESWQQIASSRASLLGVSNSLV